ncbi:MAG: glycosyltransferase family 4 protein [bacterium]|nr:glycosyltransferase family 4 protein [bacterium]
MRKRIIISPAHFTLGEGSGSESATAVKIIRDLATVFDLDVVTGNLQGPSPFSSNVVVHELYPGPVPRWTHRRRLQFLWDSAQLATKITQEKHIDVLFHLFPFDHHHGSFLPFLLPKIPLVIGPLTLPIDLLKFPDEASPEAGAAGGIGKVLLARALLPITGLLSSATIRHARMIVCESEAAKEYWSGIGEKNNRFTIMYNAHEPQFASAKRGAQIAKSDLASWGKKRPGVMLITVGNLFRRKGIDRCIEVVRQLAPRFPFPIRLLIVGDGPARQSLEEEARHGSTIAHHDLSTIEGQGRLSINFLGRVPKEKMPALYAQADIALVLPRAEAFANTAVEAMATGLPVVATDVGAMAEIIDHGKTGFLVPNDNFRLMVDQTAELVGDMKLRKKMGAAAAASVRKKFEAGRIRRAWLQIFQNV